MVSFLDSEPDSQCQMVKLSLSILNRLLLLKPHQSSDQKTTSPGATSPDQCPLELSLTSHATGLPHQPHLVAVIAGYIYHRQDPRLPTLAVLLLRRLAQVRILQYDNNFCFWFVCYFSNQSNKALLSVLFPQCLISIHTLSAHSPLHGEHSG